MKIRTLISTCVALLLLSFSTMAMVPPVKKAAKPTYTYSVAEMKKNIEYDFAKATVRESYDPRLDQLAKLMIDKNYVVALRGHADGIGGFKSNWVLSQKRADAVKEYLVGKGVAENKIVSTAFGSTIPVATNKTAEGRQQNRRVEIRLNTGSESLSAR